MADDNKFIRCKEDDPERCIALVQKGQCPYLADAGSNYCIRHKGGKVPPNPNTTQGMVGGNYNLKEQFAIPIAEKANSTSIKDLKAEVAILRVALETIINRCEDTYDLELQTDKITKLVDQINKVVLNCHKMQLASNTLLDKSIIINIGNMVVEILSRHVPDKAILGEVGREIYDAILVSATAQLEEA